VLKNTLLNLLSIWHNFLFIFFERWLTKGKKPERLPNYASAGAHLACNLLDEMPQPKTREIEEDEKG